MVNLGVTLQASLALQFSNIPTAIDDTLGGVAVNVPQGTFISVSGMVSLNIVNAIVLTGNFSFALTLDSQNHPTAITASASGVNAFVGEPGGVGLSLTNGSLSSTTFSVANPGTF